MKDKPDNNPIQEVLDDAWLDKTMEEIEKLCVMDKEAPITLKALPPKPEMNNVRSIFG